MKLTTTPYKYQEEGIDYLIKHHYAILGDDMGLGKSLQAIGLACAIKAKKVLVVCPAYLKVNWVNEFKVHTDRCNIFMSKKKTDLKTLRDSEVTVISYEMVEAINLGEYDLVISDECQYLKNMTAQRTRNFHENCRNSPPDRLVLLSGTPIKNRIPEFYSLLVICGYNPYRDSGVRVQDIYKSEFSFSSDFCFKSSFRVNGRQINKFSGLKNKEKLKKLLVGKFKRRLSKDVLELPEMVEKNVMMTFSKDKETQKLWEEFLIVGKSSHISSRKAESALLKSKFTINYVRSLLEDGQGPIVIFCDHVKSINVIGMELSVKYRAKVIDGTVTSDKRAEYAQQFQNGQLDVLACTIGSASTGFTLTKARNLVFNSFPWVGADLAQAKKRIHRIGQKERVTIHYVLGSPVDEEILETVKKKQNTIEEIM